MTAMDLTLRADLAPDLLTWGLVLDSGDDERVAVVVEPYHGEHFAMILDGPSQGGRIDRRWLSGWHLNLARPEVRDHLMRWAAVGLRCRGFEVEPGVLSGCRGGDLTADALDLDPQDECPTCGTSGYFRAPVDLGWARDNPKALAWAVWRVVGGLPVLGEIPTWVRCDDTSCWHRGWRAIVHDWEGWTSSHGGDGHRSGPETGAAGRSLVDADLSERGWWLEGGIFVLEQAEELDRLRAQLAELEHGDGGKP